MPVSLLLASFLLQSSAVGVGERFWQSNAVDGDRFGGALARAGELLFIGAPSKDPSPAFSTELGAVYVFRRQSGVWMEEHILEDDPQLQHGGDRFGGAIVVEGDLLVIGATGSDSLGPSSDAGVAIVHERAPAGTWQRVQRIVPASLGNGDEFGAGLCLQGDTLIASAPKDDDRASNAGAVYVFRRVGGVWTEEAKLVAHDGAASDLFSVPALDGDRLAIGAFDASHALGSRAGAVYTFVRGAGGWTFEQKVVASDGSTGDRFGETVHLTGDVLVVGAPDAGPGDGTSSGDGGAAYVFERSAAGVWQETTRLLSPDLSPQDFGASLGLARDRLVVGDPNARTNSSAPRLGTVHGYDHVGGSWTHFGRLTESALENLDAYGTGVHLSATELVVTAPAGGALGASNGGTAWIYELSEDFLRYCNPAVPTTAGTSALLTAHGSSFVVDNSLRLECTGMPAGVFGYFIAGDQIAFVPGAGGSFGDLCIGGLVLRFNDVVPNSGPAGRIERIVDLTQVPIIGAFTAGTPWQFQAWFRDGARSNFSNAVIVPFR